MVLAQIAFLMAIAATYTKKDDGVNPLRLGLMMGFAFCAGINVGSYKVFIVYRLSFIFLSSSYSPQI